MNEHDVLIERLARQARPVRRLAAPWTRALVWMLAALPCGFLASQVMAQVGADWSEPGALWAGLWMATSLCLAVLALTAAFTLGVPGRRIRHRRWLAACGLAWLVTGLGDVTGSADPVGHLGDGRYCYTFMLVAGIPMMIVMIGALRRTRSLYPVRSLALAGLGVAALAQVLLGFCHPVAGELVDWSMHLAASLTLIGATAFAGWRWVKV